MEYYHIKDGVLEAYTGREEVITVPYGIHTISTGAFKACVSLKKVTLPAGLLRIEGDAFKGCRKLEEIEIPKSVTFIGSYAFHRCHSLKRIILPDSVKQLGDCVFLYCDSLTEVRIPGVKRLGRQVFLNDVLIRRLEVSPDLEMDCICDVFTGCGRITEISFAGGECWHIVNAVEVIAEKPEVPPLVYRIAADILKMMEIDGRCLLRFLVNLKHVELPEGIESLAKSCFFDKRGIQSVTFPKSVKKIGSRAFCNCIGLEKISFAGEEVQIQEDAFENCTSIKTVEIGENRKYTFSGITALTKPETPKLVQTIQEQVMGNFRISGTILLKYLGAESRVAVPEGITRIAGGAFAGNEAVDRVILPESLTEIGEEAFRDCLLLQTISFPEGLKQIGAGAFENCVKLIRVTFPSKIKQIRKRTFRRCKVLREVVFSEGLQEIEESAFYGCTALKSISFPKSLTVIGEMAFYRCSGIKEVRLLAGTGKIGALAFAESGIQRAWVAGNGEKFETGIFDRCTKLKTLILEEGVRHIPDKLAYGCTALRQVILPESLVSAGRQVWENTPYLTECRENQGSVFWDGRNLKGEVWISENVKLIAGGAFYGNTEVTEIHLPKSIRWIGTAAFKGCRKLLKVWLSSEIKNLEAEVFCGCTRLEKIVLSQGNSADEFLPVWQSVGERAFYQCERLEKLCLCHTDRLGREALAGCSALIPDKVSLKLWAEERAFEGTKYLKFGEDGLCIVGNIAVSADRCEGRLCLPKGVTGIAPYAFAGNRGITEVILPEGLLRIGEGAFFGCSGLSRVELPEGLQQIEARAFEKCILLEQVDTAAEHIGEAAFAFCIGLIHARLSGVKKLSDSVFEGCGSLISCVCEKAEKAGKKSFCGCKSLIGFDFSRFYRIEEYAFWGCDSLIRAVFKEDICLENYAFLECGRLEELRFFNEGIFPAEYAFFGCTRLQRIWYQEQVWEFSRYKDIFSERLPEIIRFLFYSAQSCFEVKGKDILCAYQGTARILKIPQGIKKIEAEVFRDITMLLEVEIPNTVEYIGARAFHGTAWIACQRQKSPMVVINHMLLDGSGCVGEVTVPADIRLVCGWAFANGMGIERIRFLSETRVEQYAFRNCIFLKEVILPNHSCFEITGIKDRERELPALVKQAVMDSLNCFKTDETGVLKECTGNISRLLLASGITVIGAGAFQDGNLLTEIIFQRTVKGIEQNAFAGCKWLSEVLQAENVEYIGKMAFFGCGRLRRVELSEKFQQIGARAFENCTALEEIQIPEGVEEIPERAFYRCHSLKSIHLPSTLKKIGREAFAFCIKLEKVLLPKEVQIEERAFYKGKEEVICITEDWERQD